MDSLQFKALSIGDCVLTCDGKPTRVTDIDFHGGRIATGNGRWRDYHTVHFPMKPEVQQRHKEIREYVPQECVILSRKMLLRYGFAKVCVIRAVELCGPEGFVGTMKELAIRSEFVSGDYIKNLLPEMLREGIVKREHIKRGLFRLTMLNKE